MTALADVHEPTSALPTPAAVARRIGEDVLAKFAVEVDAEARFPAEAIAALRAEGLLGAAVPVEWGGAGAGLADIAEVARELARHCASTAMIFAMHQIQVFALVRHGRNERLREITRRVATEQLLLASATTEIGIGGDVRSSTCAVEEIDGHIRLQKNAPVISYGEYADAVLVTARRTPDSPPSDQVLLLAGQGTGSSLTLERTSSWDTLGFRGTCSNGFMLDALTPAECLFDDPYADISSVTMLPVAHLLWSSLWLGIAEQATATASRFVRAEAAKKRGTVPPSALRLAELRLTLQRFEESRTGLLRRYLLALDTPGATSDLGFVTAINGLKVSSSELLIEAVTQAMLICGISGYKNDSSFSLTRALRDAFGASVMVNNDRILTNNAQLLLAVRDR